jgi:diketogulonate reductase-like aldo/keto reductase
MPYDINASLAEKVRQSVESSLRNFTVDDAEPYIDSVVLHSPMDTIQDTLTVWRTLESYAPSKIRNLGISNATLEDIEAVFNDASLKPAVVQNRFYRDTAYEVDLRAFCRSKGIVFQSFWTITANKPLAQSPPVAKVAQGAVVGIVPAYYALVLGLDGTTILDGTTKEVHMRDDLEGIEKIGAWADGDGASEWAAALAQFKQLIREH